ncbi:MAG: hypothetical protein AAGC55_08990 [Myxococcota bacterium]
MRGTHSFAVIAAAIFALATVGCGGNDALPPTDNPGGPGGGGSDAGTDDGGGVIPDAPPSDPGGPLVEITDPTEPSGGDFSAGAIVTDDRLTVSCLVQANPETGTAVDSSSVRITAIGPNNINQEVMASPSGSSMFQGSLAISDFPNGALTLRCTASDIAQLPRQASDQILTYFDQGPSITIFDPADGVNEAGDVSVNFTVTEAPVADNDALAAADPASVKLYISGTEIDDLVGDGLNFQTNVQFDDDRFPETLEGAQTVLVEATNTRGVTRQQQVAFNADSVGPEISVVSPEPAQLVSGVIILEVSIDDEAGIDPTSVLATIVNPDNEFTLSVEADGLYRGSFDTRLLPPGIVFPTITVRARDTLGNQSSFGYVIALDNQPPILSLDSPDMREGIENAMGVLECTQLFDPLGDDALNDGDTNVAQLSEIRARIEDRGNLAPADSSVLIPVAGVDPATVQLYILDDQNGVLVVDSNGDGQCDQINPLLIPTSVPTASNEVAQLDLVALTPAGNSFLTTPAVPYSPTGPDSICSAPSSPAPTAPPPLCPLQSPATRLISADAENAVPAIYSIPPVTGVQCLGNAFDQLGTNISNGWACLAVQAEDDLGNLGISPPMRVCFGTNCSGSPPDCTGTYNPDTDVVDSATDCAIAEPFVYREVRLRL